MGKITHKWYGKKWVKTAERITLPEAASEGVLSSRDEVDGLLLTMAPAHTTTVAAQRINKGDFARRRKTNGPELAGRKAGTTATAPVLRSLGNVFSTKEKMKAVAISQQCQAIRPVTIAEATDKRRLEGPQRVDQTLLFIRLQQVHSLCLAQALENIHLRPEPKGLEKGLLYIKKLFGINAEPEAVTGVVIAGAAFTADAGHSDDGTGEIQDLVEIFKGNHLAKVISAVLSLVKPVTQMSQPCWCFKP